MLQRRSASFRGLWLAPPGRPGLIVAGPREDDSSWSVLLRAQATRIKQSVAGIVKRLRRAYLSREPLRLPGALSSSKAEHPTSNREIWVRPPGAGAVSGQQGRLVVLFIGRYQLNTTTVVSVLWSA